MNLVFEFLVKFNETMDALIRNRIEKLINVIAIRISISVKPFFLLFISGFI